MDKPYGLTMRGIIKNDNDEILTNLMDLQWEES